MEKIEMNNLNNKIGDLINSNHFLLLVLERFEIYLGLQDKTIKNICDEYKINTKLFLTIFNLHKNPNEIPEINLNADDIKILIKYIKNSHNYYKAEVLPKISKIIKQISGINDDLTYILIERFFDEYKQEVIKHLNYEEQFVFPYVWSIINNTSFKQPNYTISEYKNHHNDIEAKLSELKNLLIKHLPYKNDQKYRRDLLFELFRFEKDLRIHTIIEENILVPAIENLENKETK